MSSDWRSHLAELMASVETENGHRFEAFEPALPKSGDFKSSARCSHCGFYVYVFGAIGGTVSLIGARILTDNCSRQLAA